MQVKVVAENGTEQYVSLGAARVEEQSLADLLESGETLSGTRLA